MNVLLVWVMLPKEVSFYLIKNPTMHQLTMLRQANGKFINCDDENDGMKYLNQALASPKDAEDFAEEMIEGTEIGIWYKCKVLTPLLTPVSEAYYSGFFL